MDIPYYLLISFDAEAMKLGVIGSTITVSSGDDGITGFNFRNGGFSTKQCGYYAIWPASSSYVTAIGATMGGLQLNNSTEMVSFESFLHLS